MLYLTSVNDISDRADSLLTEVSLGNSAALAALYELTSAAVYGFALSILKNTHDAEDAMQDCFIAVSAKAASYRPGTKPMAWMLTITRNICLQKLRERQKADTLPEEDWANIADDREEMTAEDKLVLSGCMKRLNDEERQIVVLHAVAGFKHREVARMMDLALPTVLSKYSRALKKLEKFLEEESEE